MSLLVEMPFAESLAEQLTAPRHKGISIYWLGQAGFILDTPAVRIVIDPYLSDSMAAKYRGKPLAYRRMMPAPVAPEALRQVDIVLLTHQHTDHMDPHTLGPLAASNPNCLFVAPKACREEAIRRIGSSDAEIVAIDAGERLDLPGGVSVEALRAAHETLETTPEGWLRFLGYVISAGEHRIYHSGDTIPFEGLEQDVSALRPDIALLPVNGRDRLRLEQGIPGNLTLDEACALADAVGAKDMIAHHFGMFEFNTLAPRIIDARAAAGDCAATLHRARTSVEYRLADRG